MPSPQKNLKTIIHDLLAREGSLSIAEYMHLCLTHPDYGYYKIKDPLGKKGDFTTAPEIHQLFGEMIAIWFVNCLPHFPKNEPLHLIEFGPGRGTLMQDITRILLQKIKTPLTLHLIEINETLKNKQKETLKNVPCQKRWHEKIDDIKEKGIHLILGNEFFDALPFRQYQKHENQWFERAITLDSSKQLAFTLKSKAIPNEILPKHLAKAAKEGDIIELSPTRTSQMLEIATHLKHYKGLGLFIDYGYKKASLGSTFQALYKHQYCSPLEHIGEADLTNHVDFEALQNKSWEENLYSPDIMTQGDFLLSMGILERAGALGHQKPLKIQEDIQNAVERLAADTHMGKLFKVLALSSQQVPLYPFENEE